MTRKSFINYRYLNIFFSLIIACILFVATSFAAENIPANIKQSSLPLLNNFQILVDKDGQLNIEDIQKPENQSKFSALNTKEISKASGTTWLRFTLAERDPRTSPDALLLDLGDGLPAMPTLYAPKYNMLTDTAQWQEYTPTQQSIFLMPEARSTPTTAYIRLEGVPNLWFSPTLRTPHDAATTIERMAKPATIVALGVVMLLSLLRGITEKGQWRIWASLYTAVVLFYAIFGIPATPKGYIELKNMATAVAPGVALMLLPHVARHLMRSNIYSKAIDIQYILLALPGVIVALIPLIPGFAWAVHYLMLWPVLTLLLIPTTLGAWLSGLPGARRFLIGALLPPIGVAFALVGLQEPHFLPLPILQTLPLWGIALGTLIIAGTTAPQEYLSQNVEQDSELAENTNTLELAPSILDDIDDPNLRLVNIGEAQKSETNSNDNCPDTAVELEEQLRWPVDQLLRDVTALESCALPPLVREHIASLTNAAREISNAISAPVHERSTAPAMAYMDEDIFELQGLLRQAHDSVSALADSKNIALSWFMPPHLSQSYRGDAMHLLFVLRLLLESSVRATNRGAVQLAVRRVPESVNPGHLLFTVTDTGTGKPPQERSVSALARAWELAASCHGFLGVESNAHGASISFTMHCEVTTQNMHHKSQRAKDIKHPSIIIISDNDADRQLWSFFLEKLPYNIIEARNKKEILALYAEQAAKLLILDARLPLHKIEDIMSNLREYEAKKALTQVLCLVLAPENISSKELQNAGLEHSLAMPITRSSLRNIVAELLPGFSANKESLVDTKENNKIKQNTLAGNTVNSMPDINMAESSVPQDQEIKPLGALSDAQENPQSNDSDLKLFEAPPTTSTKEHQSNDIPTAHTEQEDIANDLEAISKVDRSIEVESSPTVQDKPKAKIEILSKAKSEAQSQPEAQPKPESQPEAQPDVQIDFKSKPKTQLAIKTHAAKKIVKEKEQDKPATTQTSVEHDIAKQENKSTQEKEIDNRPKIQITAQPRSKTSIATAKQSKNDTAMVQDEPKAIDNITTKPSEQSNAPKQKVATKNIVFGTLKPTQANNLTSANEVKTNDAHNSLQNMEPLSLHTQSPTNKPKEEKKAKSESSLSDGILLPLIDSLSEAAPVANVQEQSLEKVIVHKDKTNAAYLTSLIDSTPSKQEPHVLNNKFHAVEIDQGLEWVGEPQPIMKKNDVDKEKSKTVSAVSSSKATEKDETAQVEQQATKTTLVKDERLAKQASKVSSAPQEEWVGEPQPITKKTPDKKPNTRIETAPPLPDSTSATPLQNMLSIIDSNILEAKAHFDAANTEGVATHAEQIALSAENFGLRTLGRLARTVEAAAKAGDMDALYDLLPELEISVERNRIALKA